ncbi:MAG TPA: histidine kinase dimerization/phospho-acceptor domain-containing protein [Chloroflexota bacterium]|nr:histidine kinase dimerization/phospho-acceptor domain-containing protein [Chloroflexota bacterium]
MSPAANSAARPDALGREQEDPVAVVCHKLRTPLTAALGFLQLAMRSPASSDGHHDQLMMVDEQLRRMARLLDELSAQARED